MINRRNILLGGMTIACGAAPLSALAQQAILAQQTEDILGNLSLGGALPPFVDQGLLGKVPFPITLGRATYSLLFAMSDLSNALKDHQAAKQYSVMKDSIVGKPSRKDIIKAQELIISNPIDLKKLKTVKSDEADALIQHATMYSGISLVYHAIAVNQGKKLASSTANGLKGAISGGVGGAFRGIRRLKQDRRPLMLAQAVARTLPQNLNNVKKIYIATREYSKVNNLAAPTKEEADVILKSDW